MCPKVTTHSLRSSHFEWHLCALTAEMLMVPITGATPLLLEVVLLIVSVSNTWPEASLRQLWCPDTWRTPTVSNKKKAWICSNGSLIFMFILEMGQSSLAFLQAHCFLMYQGHLPTSIHYLNSHKGAREQRPKQQKQKKKQQPDLKMEINGVHNLKD